MKVDVSTVILDVYGKPVKKSGTEDDYLVRDAILIALINFPLPPDDKPKAFAMAVRVADRDEVTFTTDEQTVLLRQVKDVMNPLEWGRIDALFNPEEPCVGDDYDASFGLTPPVG